MARPTSRPDGDRTFDETRALEHLLEPVDPVVFDPNPSGSDMPEPSSSDSGSSSGEGGLDQSAGTAD